MSPVTRVDQLSGSTSVYRRGATDDRRTGTGRSRSPLANPSWADTAGRISGPRAQAARRFLPKPPLSPIAVLHASERLSMSTKHYQVSTKHYIQSPPPPPPHLRPCSHPDPRRHADVGGGVDPVSCAEGRADTRRGDNVADSQPEQQH